MQRENRLLKPMLLGGMVFITLGVSLATEMLSRFGLQDNYVIVFSAALVLAAMILSKNMGMLLLVVGGVVLCNLPQATLLQFNLDRDVLLAGVFAVICAPVVYDLFIR